MGSWWAPGDHSCEFSSDLISIWCVCNADSACVAVDFEKVQRYTVTVWFLGITFGGWGVKKIGSWWEPFLWIFIRSDINVVCLHVLLLVLKRCKVTKENLFGGKRQLLNAVCCSFFFLQILCLTAHSQRRHWGFGFGGKLEAHYQFFWCRLWWDPIWSTEEGLLLPLTNRREWTKV